MPKHSSVERAAQAAGLKRDENESDDALMDRVRVSQYEVPEEHPFGEPMELTALNQPSVTVGNTTLRLKPKRR